MMAYSINTDKTAYLSDSSEDSDNFEQFLQSLKSKAGTEKYSGTVSNCSSDDFINDASEDSFENPTFYLHKDNCDRMSNNLQSKSEKTLQKHYINKLKDTEEKSRHKKVNGTSNKKPAISEPLLNRSSVTTYRKIVFSSSDSDSDNDITVFVDNSSLPNTNKKIGFEPANDKLSLLCKKTEDLSISSNIEGNKKIPNKEKSKKPVFVFSSSSDSEIEFPFSKVKINPVLTSCENKPPNSKNITKPKNDEGNYKSLLSRIKQTDEPLKRSSSLGKMYNSPEHTGIENIPIFQTEKKQKTSFRAKSSNGLPQNLPPRCDFGKEFKKNRECITKILFKFFNEEIFENQLDTEMEVTWAKRLTKTAGITKCRKRCVTKYTDGKKSVEITHSSSISLSEKVIDTLQRLRDTLVHEMCHAAVWVVNKINEGHGPYWKWWAQRAMKKFPDMPVIKRCHSYDITYKYYYKCNICKQTIGRHSKSLKTESTRCGICGGKFVLEQQQKADGTPAKSRIPNKFALFVKENYNNVKERKLECGIKNATHSDIMKELSKDFAKVNV